jgi:hypothetical protein
MNMKAEFEVARKEGRAVRRAAQGLEQAAVQTARPLGALQSLKARLLDEQLTDATDAELRGRLHRAAEEAASLAWTTPIPLLALPELLAEKAREAWRQFERQRSVQGRNQPTVSLAA